MMEEYFVKNELQKDYEDDERIWTVYVHIVPKEVRSSPDRDDYYDKYYVGICSTPVEARWGKDGNKYRTQGFYNAIKKYGWNNIEHEIIAEHLTDEEACKMEIELIKQLKCYYKYGPYGYNQNSGGHNTYHGFLDYSNMTIENLKVNKILKKERERKYGHLIITYNCTCLICGKDCVMTNKQIAQRLSRGKIICCNKCSKEYYRNINIEEYCSKNKMYIKDGDLYIECGNDVIKCDGEYYDELKNYTVYIQDYDHNGLRIMCYKSELKNNNYESISLSKILQYPSDKFLIHLNENHFDFRKENIYITDRSLWSFFNNLARNYNNDRYLINVNNNSKQPRYFIEHKIYKRFSINEKHNTYLTLHEAVNERNRILNIIADSNEVLALVIRKYYKYEGSDVDE